MTNLLDRFVFNKHQLYFEVEDLIRVIQVINDLTDDYWGIKRLNLSSGSCRWEDRKKWYVKFTASESNWEKIRYELGVIRVWDVKDIPANTIGVVYSDD